MQRLANRKLLRLRRRPKALAGIAAVFIRHYVVRALCHLAIVKE